MPNRIPPSEYYSIRLPIIRRELLRDSWWRDDYRKPREMGCHGMSAVVSHGSPEQLRKAVETMAYYFRREFGYDFVQYSTREREDDGHRAFIWTSSREHCMESPSVIGACCFRWREYDKVPDELPQKFWALQWIWLHPYERGKGLLTKAWPYFTSRFGPFVPEPPFSKTMDSFLKRMNYHPDQNWPQFKQ